MKLKKPIKNQEVRLAPGIIIAVPIITSREDQDFQAVSDEIVSARGITHEDQDLLLVKGELSNAVDSPMKQLGILRLGTMVQVAGREEAV
jgi:hypothetical protein